ncbi:MAG: glycosyltransferase family 2 protein [Chloroflexi bacterium]|nr:glycosyltransferase family 2 protein [Chloroflexota bacterium]
MIVSIVFWACLVFLGYTLVLFPVLLLLRRLLSPRPYRAADITPSVSVVIAAYNEVDSIGAKLDNMLALTYPKDCLEIIVASDGSDDGTDDVVRRYLDHGVRLLSLPRQGKAGALNAAVSEAHGEILVFSDANSMYGSTAIQALVRPFADPEVGGVAGNQRYLDQQAGSADNAGERSYWQLDRLLKRLQSDSGNTISATGAIYAIRKSLFLPVPPGVTDDFVTSTRVIAAGYRLVFAADAVAYEPVASSSDREFGRKVRIMTRGLRAVLTMRELLNPFRFGFYAVQLFTHKVLRRVIVLPLLLLFVSSLFLWQENVFYLFILALQIAFYGCALLGFMFRSSRLGQLKPLAIPYFICMVYAAALVAIFNTVSGRRIDRWNPQRQS